MVMMSLMIGCAVKPGEPVKRHGDEIVAAGQRFRIGTPVVLWTDPGGYNAYSPVKRFGPIDREVLPPRYNVRFGKSMSEDELLELREEGYTLDRLRDAVDLFVIHYDACGTSRRCFDVLHDQRGLSVHFMLDLDGTIYQTLDLKERAWHAGPFNDRSVGIEIANIGAYPTDDAAVLKEWYTQDADGARVVLPPDAGLRTPGFIARPARGEPVVGEINQRTLVQYDLTPQQYDALIKLTAALSRVLPKIQLDAPRGPDGAVLTDVMSDEELAAFQGVIGHNHLTAQKRDPGPAFEWDRVLDGARRSLWP